MDNGSLRSHGAGAHMSHSFSILFHTGRAVASLSRSERRGANGQALLTGCHTPNTSGPRLLQSKTFRHLFD